MNTPTRKRPTPRPLQTAPKPEFEPIDPTWLLKAIAYTVLAALICGYLTLCLLFYQGQWQLILHPQQNTTALSTLASLPAQPVRFDAAETGSPRLSGALLPATLNARYTAYTVLYLRGGEASLAQSPTDARNLELLHTLGLNLFAFDYRGYGQSDPTRPNHLRMTEDAVAALRYLTDTRAIPETRLILYGNGLGASLATSLAAANPKIPALILDSPGQDPLTFALADPRTRLLPVRALFHEDFPLESLTHLPTPKLLISYPTPASPQPRIFRDAANPKLTLELNPADATNQASGISRFLDQTLTHAPATLKE